MSAVFDAHSAPNERGEVTAVLVGAASLPSDRDASSGWEFFPAIDPPLYQDLSLEQASLGRCEALGMIPLQLVRWNPALVHAAVTGGVPLYLRAFKRTVDIFAVAVLGVLVLPFLAFIILAIRRDSEGPIFYSQTRLGENGRHFRIYKFRSMYINSEAGGPQFARINDSRITPFGQFMRRTRIDEIPQLWNVLKGDMSIVGPRPERPEHMEHIETAIPEFPLRLAVKPGLTGWAQTSYQYAGTVDELRTKLEYDLYYIQFASVWMEILILFRTVKIVFSLKGQ